MVRLIISLLAMAACLAVGPLFTIKRALIHGVRRTTTGRRTVLALFERLRNLPKDPGSVAVPADGRGNALA